MAGDNERALRVFNASNESRGGTNTQRTRGRSAAPDQRSPARGIVTHAAVPARRHGLGAAAAILALTLGINVFAVVPPLAVLLLLDQSLIAATVDNIVIVLLAVAFALVLEILLTAARRVLLAWRAAGSEHAAGQRLFASVLAARRASRPGGGSRSDADCFAALGGSRDLGDERIVGFWLDMPFALLFLALIHAIGGWLAAVPAALLASGFVLALAGDRRARRAALEADAVRGRQDSFALETLGRIRSIKSAALEAPMMRRFERLLATMTAAEERAARGSVAGQVWPAMMVVASAVAVAAAGGPALMAGELGVAELIACMLLAARTLYPAQNALVGWSGSRRDRLVRHRLRSALAPPPPARLAGLSDLQRLQGAVTLEEVTLRSEGGGRPLLDRVSMQIAAGAMIGINGAAGSGKTALLMLLAGQQRPDSGRVLLDGRFDPFDNAEDGLLRQVIYVPDHAPIFAGTLLENITMFAASAGSAGSPQARDRAYDLAERLGLLPLAGRLPMGFNTKIGPGTAVSLPQGIAQRVALARAFFAAPRILLFDVANAALDPAGDDLVRRLLDEERGTCTMLIVSQRPSLLRLTDRVYTLADGHLRSPSPSRHMSMVRQRVSA